MTRPVVGVTTQPRSLPLAFGELQAHTLGRHYTEALVRAGAIPVALSPVDGAGVEELLARLDGLVLTGGGDVDPARYGRDRHPSVDRVDPERDAFELALTVAAAAARLPLLGVCRGMEVANVALGGDLVVDIPAEVGSQVVHRGPDTDPVVSHLVRIEAGSRLGGLVRVAQAPVNSWHHQAVRNLGAGLRAVAWAHDGVIEAAESVDGDWPFVGVQWHPELLGPDDLLGTAPFETLVSAARKVRGMLAR